MTDTPQRTDPRALREFARDVLARHQVPIEDAALVADSLVQADLWGHQSHGVLRLPWYVDRIRAGAMRAESASDVLVDTGPLVLLDGRNGIGQVLTDRARVIAVERARLHGIGAVGVRNSNHFGAAMYYTRRAAADGCVAILTTNASPAMAPWGGREKRLGTNPWSIAAPWNDRVVAVDIANTAVARGKIYLARQRGEEIPDSWALGPDGKKTTDAALAVEGVILPMAQHKGYAITFMMDVLSGALTGSAVGMGVHGPFEASEPSGAGHLFLAIDVATLGPAAQFAERVGELVDQVKSTPLAEGHDEIFYPGELEDRAEQRNREAGGVALPDNTRSDLQLLAEATGVAFPEAR